MNGKQNRRQLGATAWLVLILASIAWQRPALAQSVSSDLLGRVRKACVYIHNKHGQGTGFIFERTDRSAKIATAAHVICDDGGSVFEELRVVLNSGTSGEKTLTAKVLGIDVPRDVAFLEIRGKNLPEPIYLAPDAQVVETMDVVFAGFPYGEQLAVGSNNPALSISKGAVSSVRLGATNATAVIQLDANINPGNSGGPVLNASGEVIGLVQAKIDGTSLGFAIPASQVVSDLMGDLAKLSVSVVAPGTVVIDARMIDPLGRLDNAQVAVASITSVPSFNLQANKGWPLISKNFISSLSTSVNTTSASLRLPVNNIPIVETAVQIVCHRVDGTTVNSRPFALKLLIEEYEAARENARKPREPEAPAPSSPNKPPETKPKPSVPPEPITPLIVQSTEPRLLKNLNKRSSNVRPGILSTEMPLGDYKVRRVMVPHSRFAPMIIWNEVGDRLVVVGDQTCVIDYPHATEIAQYELPGYRYWSHVRGDQWLYVDSGRVNVVDLADGQTSAQWVFSRPVHATSLANSDTWLLRTRNQSQVYLLNEDTHDLETISLPEHDDTGEPEDHEVFISPDKTQLFDRQGDQVSRYVSSQGHARLDESVRVSKSALGHAKLLPSSDAQILLLLSTNKSVANRKSLVVAYAAQNLSRKFAIDVPDYIRGVVRDPIQNRVIMAGLDQLWFWYPREGKLQPVPFLKSAPTIDAIALHPKGDTLAVLCGSSGSNAALYWVQLKPMPKS